MNILIIPLVICVIFICFLLYETYQYRKEYKIYKKISINNGETLEYYFILKQKSNKHIFKIQVDKKVYDLYNLEDHIIIF